jgi:hypothetical protein
MNTLEVDMIQVAALLVCNLCQGICGSSIDKKALDYWTKSELKLFALHKTRKELAITLLATKSVSFVKFLSRS